MLKLIAVIVAGIALGGCVSVAPTAHSLPILTGETDAELWRRRSTAIIPLEIAWIEAELGARGQEASPPYHDGSRYYLGFTTSSALGHKVYARNWASVGTDRNCSDFSSSALAQKFFLEAGGPARDPHGLDRDGDGLACDWGTKLQQVAKKYSGMPALRRVSHRSVCYTGPRGGRYTITASGRRNYNGC